MALSRIAGRFVLCCLAATGACLESDDGDQQETSNLDGGAADARVPDSAAANDSGTRDSGSVADARGPDAGGSPTAPSARMSFFVTSDTSMTGELGGLTGADARCQELAEAVGAGDKTWRAYLSIEYDPAKGNQATHARDRIGEGPWYNSAGALLANDLDELHERTGDAELFLDEHGAKINGQWLGSPTPNEHDVLTGSDADGRVVPGMTCNDWTSASADLTAQVGHSDGLGPMQDPSPPRNSWNSAHPNRGCNDTAPAGGAGRIYCFAEN